MLNNTEKTSSISILLSRGSRLMTSSKLFQDSSSFFLPFLLGSPKLVPVFLYVPQHRPPDENQVFPARGVLNVELEFLQPGCVALEDVLQIPEKY